MRASLSFPAVISKIAVYSAVMLACGCCYACGWIGGFSPSALRTSRVAPCWNHHQVGSVPEIFRSEHSPGLRIQSRRSHSVFWGRCAAVL